VADLFWAKVDKNGPVPAHRAELGNCWEWAASTLKGGYGYFKYAGKTAAAHRFSWQLRNGQLPAGAHVLHHCDNPRCVRPEHLFVGNNTDNVADKVSKGRTNPPRGDNHYRAKLSTADVVQIRSSLAAGVPRRDLAARYGVSRSIVDRIATRETWASV